MAASVSRNLSGRSPNRRFTVLVANDGSPRGQAAVRAAVDFPWPRNADGTGLVAWGGEHWAARVYPEALVGVPRIARETERLLRRRWPKAAVEMAEALPIEAILRRDPKGGAIVLGAHGYSALRRWVLGSVTRAVVRRTRSSVLVIKDRRPSPRHLAIGFDGSPNARRAVAFVAKLSVPRNGRVTLLGLSEAVRPPTILLLPSNLRGALMHEVRAINAKRIAKVERQLARAATTLKAAGWKVKTEARPGVAVRDLVRLAMARGADLIAVGARGTSGLRRILLGSVAEAVVDQSPLPVLLIR